MLRRTIYLRSHKKCAGGSAEASPVVIPDKRRSRAAPEAIEGRLALRWIPALRFAAAGMTAHL